jgi:transmembrane sensor
METMGPDVGTVHSNQTEAAASVWVVRPDAGSWSAADQASLEQWLAASTVHRVAFLRLQLAWDEALA